MTIYTFIETYNEKTLLGDPISVSTTSLRNWIKENRQELAEENIVNFIKKLNSVNIDIINPEGLYKKIS